MMKKVQRLTKALTVVALPIVLVFTLINILLLAQFKSTDTTLILKERVVQKGSDTSSSDTNTSKDKMKERVIPVLEGVHGDTVEKKSLDGEKESNKPQDKGGIENTENDKVLMQDDGVDTMIKKLQGYSQSTFFPKYFWNSTLHELTRTFGVAARKVARTLAGYKTIKL